MRHGWCFVRTQWSILRKPSHLSISFFLCILIFWTSQALIWCLWTTLILCTGKIGCMPFTWVNSAKNLDIHTKLHYHITIKLLLWTHQLLILSIGCMPHVWNYYLSVENRIWRFWRFSLPFLIIKLYFAIILFVFDIVHLFWLH